MKFQTKLNAIWLLSVLLLLLSSCASASLQANETEGETLAQAPAQVVNQPAQPAAAQPSATLPTSPTATPEPSATPSPTQTATPTETLTPTPSATPTMTPSPTPDRVLPGYYPVGMCASKTVTYQIRYDFCVIGVTIRPDRMMVFSVTWKMSGFPMYVRVNKGTDKGNPNMYLTDLLGNRYNHIDGTEGYFGGQMVDGLAMPGTFLFPAPPRNAFEFTFHEGDNNLVIKGISLRTRVILYEELAVQAGAMQLSARKDLWEFNSAADGSPLLVNKRYPACTLRESSNNQPQGKLKNTLLLGQANYEIYGYIDSARNLGIREYLAVSGLPALENAKPMFVVEIPLDQSQNCLLDLSEVLATLQEK